MTDRLWCNTAYFCMSTSSSPWGSCRVHLARTLGLRRGASRCRCRIRGGSAAVYLVQSSWAAQARACCTDSGIASRRQVATALCPRRTSGLDFDHQFVTEVDNPVTIQLAEDLVPAARFKNQQAAMLRRLRETGRAMVITQHGVAAAVVVTPEEYDRLTERADFMLAIAAGEAAEADGRLVPHAEAKRRLEAASRGGQ